MTKNLNKMKTKQIAITMIALLIVVQIISIASALTITSVSSYPNEIAPGESVSLSLTVENNLDDDIEDVVVSLDLTNVPFAPYQSSNQVTFSKIKEDSEKEISLDLISFANAESGTYKIPVEMSYKYNNTIRTDSGVISLIVNAKPIIDVSVENSVLIKGKSDKLNIKIVNSGLGGLKFLTIKVGSASGLKMVGSDSVYIGNIDSDDFDTAEFDIFVNENAPSSINLPLEISYRDSRNNEIKENKNLILRSYTNEEAIQLGLTTKNNTLTYIGIAVGLVVIYLIYRGIKKRRKKKALERGG